MHKITLHLNVPLLLVANQSVGGSDKCAATDVGMIKKKNLVGMTKEELHKEFASVGWEPFRLKQLWHWIYYRGTHLVVKESRERIVCGLATVGLREGKIECVRTNGGWK